MMIQSNCLSEVDVKLSQVNVLMSEINHLISQCPVPVQSRKLLPRINVILSEMTFVVSYAQTDSSSGEDIDDESLKKDVNDGDDDYDNIAIRVMARRRLLIHPDDVDCLVI